MRISTNLDALTAYNSLARATLSQSKAIERISSGYRINRAADDAAGLSMSETMRGKIGGLQQAARNGQDAISFLQTAEGALGEISAILQRVRDLAVQYHNGALTPDDQKAIQAEARQLSSEAIAIGDQTSFNGSPLLGRDTTTVSFQVGADDHETISVATASVRGLLGVTGVEPGLRGYEYYVQPIDTTIDLVATAPGAGGTPVTTHFSYLIPANSTMQQVEDIVNNDPSSPVQVTSRYDAPNDSYAFGFYNKSYGPDYDTVATGGSIAEWAGYHDRYPGLDGSPAFELGDHNDLAQVDDAITAISGARAEAGASQNRVEHRLNSVLVYQESLTAAESRIRDADIAQEVTAMTKADILAQAATTMVAQANQAPRLVLTLLNH
jgi:flagellin